MGYLRSKSEEEQSHQSPNDGERPTHLVRYRTEPAYDGNMVSLKLERHRIVRHTPKGYWIARHGYSSFSDKPDGYTGEMRWVSSDETLRKFAYIEPENALNHYKMRTRKYIDILRYQLAKAMAGLHCCRATEELEAGSKHKPHCRVPELGIGTHRLNEKGRPYKILDAMKEERPPLINIREASLDDHY